MKCGISSIDVAFAVKGKHKHNMKILKNNIYRVIITSYTSEAYGVAKIDNLQNKLIKLARGGFKHHTTVANGHVKSVLEEAFGVYLGYNVVSIEK